MCLRANFAELVIIMLKSIGVSLISSYQVIVQWLIEDLIKLADFVISVNAYL